MFNLTDAETPFFNFHAQFTDPMMFAVIEDEQDSLGEVVAYQPKTRPVLNDRTGYIDGRWVGYTSSGIQIHID